MIRIDDHCDRPARAPTAGTWLSPCCGALTSPLSPWREEHRAPRSAPRLQSARSACPSLLPLPHTQVNVIRETSLGLGSTAGSSASRTAKAARPRTSCFFTADTLDPVAAATRSTGRSAKWCSTMATRCARGSWPSAVTTATWSGSSTGGSDGGPWRNRRSRRSVRASDAIGSQPVDEPRSEPRPRARRSPAPSTTAAGPLAALHLSSLSSASARHARQR